MEVVREQHAALFQEEVALESFPATRAGGGGVRLGLLCGVPGLGVDESDTLECCLGS